MISHYQTLCFPPCATTDDGRVTRPLAQISCYVYNNGNPEKPGLLPSEVFTLFTSNNPPNPKTTLIIPQNSANAANPAVAIPTTVDPTPQKWDGPLRRTGTLSFFRNEFSDKYFSWYAQY